MPSPKPPQEPQNQNKPSKYQTDCQTEQRASLECSVENYENRDTICKDFFEDYKRCRKLEHERRLEANAGKSFRDAFG